MFAKKKSNPLEKLDNFGQVCYVPGFTCSDCLLDRIRKDQEMEEASMKAAKLDRDRYLKTEE